MSRPPHPGALARPGALPPRSNGGPPPLTPATGQPARSGHAARHADPLQEARAEVRAVYAELERRPVERACTRLTECCQFRLTGRTPQLTRGEALVALAAWRATGRKGLPPTPADGSCPLLDPATGRCGIYAGRPFGCRTHFCRAAGGPYERREVLDLIRRLELVDAKLGYREGPRPLAAALTAEGKAEGRR